MIKKHTVIGIISDTHGLLRESVIREMEGCSLIVHAGDIGMSKILKALKAIAPLVAVKGNMDGGDWAAGLPEADVVEFAEQTIYVIHDLNRLDLEPQAAGITVVVFGHTHLPAVARQNGILYINPGSAGPRRFGKPLTAARLKIQPGRMIPEIIQLD